MRHFQASGCVMQLSGQARVSAFSAMAPQAPLERLVRAQKMMSITLIEL